MRSRPTLLLLVLALTLAALATACSSGGGDGSATGTTTPGASTTVAGQAGCVPFHGVTTQLTSTGKTAPGFLTDATAEAVDCLDKVTFVFDSKGDVPPGYDVHYQDVTKQPLQDCGQDVTMPGEAFLIVVLKPAASSNPFAPEGEQDTYKGNLRLSYGATHHLQIVEKTCDGDGTVNWVIGLDSVRPFVVDRAVDPIRVSVVIG
ncbi:MAG: hypothetical protein U0W40_05400 [Acidimicrobiia bacterium]